MEAKSPQTFEGHRKSNLRLFWILLGVATLSFVLAILRFWPL